MSRERWLTGNVSAPTSYICRRVLIPNDLAIIMAVNGAILSLTREYNWEQFGTATVEETTALMTALFYDYVGSNVCMIGSIFAYATNDPPNNCLPCDGGTYARVDYPELFGMLDAAFIVDSDNFVTPDLRGRTVIGAGGAYNPADIGGEEEHTLTDSEMPAHTHTYAAEYLAARTGAVDLHNYLVNDFGGTIDTSSTGGGAAHNNMQPYLALKYCMAAR